MAYTDIYNRSAIGTEKGCDKALMAEVDYTNSMICGTLKLTGPVIKMPVMQSSEMTDVTATNDVSDESGVKTKTLGDRTSTFKATVMQQDKATLEFMTKTGYNKYFTIVKPINNSEIAGKKMVVAVVPFAKAIPSMSIKKPGLTQDWEFAPEVGTGTITIDLTSFAGTNFFANDLTCTVFSVDTSIPIHIYDQA